MGRKDEHIAVQWTAVACAMACHIPLGHKLCIILVSHNVIIYLIVVRRIRSMTGFLAPLVLFLLVTEISFCMSIKPALTIGSKVAHHTLSMLTEGLHCTVCETAAGKCAT